jgi:tRNA-splicing ligase RtcB (3'-phosphate/5'-hydroxy nucleic acid ligase)
MGRKGRDIRKRARSGAADVQRAAGGAERQEAVPAWVPREEPASSTVFGSDIDDGALRQLADAAALPVSVAAALMPDAHVGYGLPIGGVLATDGVVIPYAVGVDIACRMRLTVYDAPATTIEAEHDRLCKVLERETLFGTGASFKTAHDHAVLDEDWAFHPVVAGVRERAIGQLGSSGSGNHFAEFGVLDLAEAALGVPAGRHLALLTHSGSRGAGARIADHFSRRAMDLHPELPKELRRLAWLELDSEEGQAYWQAMELMGLYAAANHELIHRKVTRALKADVRLEVENHHNFAWREMHGGRDVVVHRKGATPAGAGVLGVIPGSMATPGYLVRGKGEPRSLRSASHGAGRTMSRKQATETFRWAHVRPQLAAARVTLLSAGIDEVPGSYKDIASVMAAQTELVDVLARFEPRIVKMAPAGEKPEEFEQYDRREHELAAIQSE